MSGKQDKSPLVRKGPVESGNNIQLVTVAETYSPDGNINLAMSNSTSTSIADECQNKVQEVPINGQDTNKDVKNNDITVISNDMENGHKMISADIEDGPKNHRPVTVSDLTIKEPDELIELNELKGEAKDDVDRASVFSLYMENDGRYYFQHPYTRLFVAYLVVFCNFLITAEDPVAHSRKECTIPVIGNSFSFVITYYPPNAWTVLKVFLWLIAIVCGLLVGKFIIHKLLLNRLLRLKMFSADQGSFMTMFITTIMSLFVFSWIYNAFLLIGGDDMKPYRLSSLMGVKNSFFMKAAACGTWLGDFFTAWMVTDIMLQEKLYPGWAKGARAWWTRGYNRIILFWIVMTILTIIVIAVISTDIIVWDKLNHDFLPTNELSRAFLASFILVMDLLILMQDWDFPHFINNFDIKLPGLNTAHIKFDIPKCLSKYKESWTVHISGKWFNYGIILLVMILDLNMWKNQIFYSPYEYGQYTDNSGKVYTVRNEDQLKIFNESQLTHEYRSININNATNATYMTEDDRMNSKYLGISLGVKSIAFIPALLGFVLLAVLIFLYGRFNRPKEDDPYGGRLKKRPKRAKFQVNKVSQQQRRQQAVVTTKTHKGKRMYPDTSGYPLNWDG